MIEQEENRARTRDIQLSWFNFLASSVSLKNQNNGSNRKSGDILNSIVNHHLGI